MNGYGKLRRMTDRNPAIVLFYLYLAAAFVTIRQLIQRAAPATAGTPAPPPNASSDHQLPGALSDLWLLDWKGRCTTRWLFCWLLTGVTIFEKL